MSNIISLPVATEGQGFAQPCVGELVGVNSKGQPLVDFPANPAGTLAARCVGPAIDPPAAVVLWFENGDPKAPIIMGPVRNTLAVTRQEVELALPELPKQAQVDGRRVELAAKDEVVLRCGKSEITLRKNGKIILRGVDIVTRAAQANKIKGASVEIN